MPRSAFDEFMDYCRTSPRLPGELEGYTRKKFNPKPPHTTFESAWEAFTEETIEIGRDTGGMRESDYSSIKYCLTKNFNPI